MTSHIVELKELPGWGVQVVNLRADVVELGVVKKATKAWTTRMSAIEARRVAKAAGGRGLSGRDEESDPWLI